MTAREADSPLLTSYPVIAVGVAMAAGVALGAMTAPRRSRARALRDMLPGKRMGAHLPPDTLAKVGRIVGEIVIARVLAAAAARSRASRGTRTRERAERRDARDFE